ncbi:MAG: hypothetical protein J1G02_04230 [Clostridiales bacterium]|nr:hypothetical protein [Clostridiales bacterium]
MSWFNYYGLIAVVIILIPNIISAVIDKGAFENKYNNKAMLVLEQVGRYGCMAFMVFNVPYTYFNFWFNHALLVYLIVNGILLVLYLLGWIIFRKGRSAAKMLWLSVTPTVLFIFSGIMLLSVPLITFAVIFGIGHITISYNNRINGK